MMGNSLFARLIALRADIEGYPNRVIGLMTSSYFFGFAIRTLRAAPLINQVGHIRSFAAFSAITSAVILSFLLVLEPSWVGLRMIMGASIAGCFVVNESWLTNRATNQNRGILLSIYMIIVYLASAISQQSLRLGDPGCFNIFPYAGILLALSIVPIPLTRATHSDPVQKPQVDIRQLLFISPTAVLGCIISGIVLGSLWDLGPVYAHMQGLRVNQIATFMSISVVGGLLFQIPIRCLSDHFDRRKALLTVSIPAMLAALLLSIGSRFNRQYVFKCRLF